MPATHNIRRSAQGLSAYNGTWSWLSHGFLMFSSIHLRPSALSLPRRFIAACKSIKPRFSLKLRRPRFMKERRRNGSRSIMKRYMGFTAAALILENIDNSTLFTPYHTPFNGSILSVRDADQLLNRHILTVSIYLHQCYSKADSHHATAIFTHGS
jgi:hypothetical protein